MADMMQYDLVSPERSLASGQASEVRIPGSEGDMTAMPNHAPLITTLRPGVLTIVGTDGAQDYAVTGGFAEVTAAGASILAEKAVRTADMSAEEITSLVEDAENTLSNASGDAKDAATKYLADLQALRATLGV